MDAVGPSVIVRRYVANQYDEALADYEADVERMAEQGWFPVGQSWGWDAVSSAGVFFGGSSWKPGRGILAVTYRFDRRDSRT